MSPPLRMKFHLRIDFSRSPLTGAFYSNFDALTESNRMGINLCL